ncbi:glycosyltransferase [Candidatus Saccharibacteria bacterium]|nr:glycosyltransferase [Candidatus Saccharibacteria bacterium]
MISKPAVSVIMAEYNTNTVDLRVAIKSILDQTFRDFEFLIVDDGGRNNLKKIVGEFRDSRIRVINNNGNKGFVYSLNNAIRHSRTDYLVRMDTDDTVTSDRIQILYNFITTHPEFDVVSSKAVEFSGNQTFGTIGKAGEKTKRDVMRGDMPIHAASIMRKKALVDIGGYKENYLRAEDLVLWCDLLLAGKRLYMLDDVLYHYRVNRSDYKKRSLRYRGGEIRARMFYYPKLGAGPLEYIRIAKSILAGIAPIWLIRLYRNTRNKNDE